MAAKYLEVAVILSAVDRMSTIIRNATSNGAAGFNALANSKEKADAALRSGMAMGAGAAAGIATLNKFSDAFGEAQEAQLNLRASMMGPNGALNESVFSKLQQFSVDMSAQFAGSQKDYIDMIQVMKENRLNPSDILGGIGKSVAELSELFNMPPKNIGLFAARMRNDMRVPVNEMDKMVDLATRLKNISGTLSGAETVSNLTELFSKAGLGATNLRMSGTKDATDLGVLGSMYIAKGIDAATVGTTFRRIFDNIGDPKKLAKMNEEAGKFGKHLQFFDSVGRFKGIDNFVAQVSTLKDLKTEQVSAILDEFGSKQGMGGSVMKNLAHSGLEDYLTFQKQVADQADIHKKVHEIQKGYNQQLRITHSNIENLSASVGKSYNPAMTKAAQITGHLAKTTGEWVERYQGITEILADVTIAITGALSLGAAFKIVSIASTFAISGWALAISKVNYAVFAARYALLSFSQAIGSYVAPAVTALITTLSAAAASVGAVIMAFGSLALIVAYTFVKNLPGLEKYAKGYKHIADNATAAHLAIEKFKHNKIIAGATDKVRLHQRLSGNFNESGYESMFSTGKFSFNKADRKPYAQTVLHYSPVINVTGDSSKMGKVLKDNASDLWKFLEKNVDGRRDF